MTPEEFEALDEKQKAAYLAEQEVQRLKEEAAAQKRLAFCREMDAALAAVDKDTRDLIANKETELVKLRAERVKARATVEQEWLAKQPE